MTQTTTIDAVSRTAVIKRRDCTWSESAYLGEIGEGTFVIHDDAASITAVGYKTIITEQSATAAWPRLFTGFVGQKTTVKTGDTGIYGATARQITVATKDGNDLLARYILQGEGSAADKAAAGKRPAETVGARVTWLLASGFLPDVDDYGRVTYSDLGMDATDYRGQRPGDVLAACARRANFNYYVRWSVTDTAWELVFRDDNAQTTDTSSISISNVLSEINSTSVFAFADGAELTEDPEDVYSGMYGSWAKGPPVYETRAATATAFVARDGSTDSNDIKTEAQAHIEAQQQLQESKTEEHILTGTLRMRAAYVNLIRPGQRVSVKQTHLATQGYNSATYFLVLRRKVAQPLDTDNDYDVALDLSPQEAAIAATGIVQSAFTRGSHNGVLVSFPNPVTVGSKLVAMIGEKAGSGDPAPPNTSSGLPRFGAGAWTRFNGSTLTRAGGVSVPQNGVSAYYKTADSTEQECYFATNGGVVGVWELPSTADPASATVADEDNTTGGTTYTIGSIGSPAAGSVVLAIWAMGTQGAGGPEWSWDYNNSYPWQTPDPNPNIAAGWSQRISKWAGGDGWSLTAFLPASPWVVIADAIGTGAALSATLTPGQSGHVFGAIALVIP